MPPLQVVLDATVGGASANTYVSLDDADEYFLTSLYATTWDAASDDRKNRALATATRLLDTWYEWDGEIASATQALAWPRLGVPRPNRGAATNQHWLFSNQNAGLVEPSDEIPQPIRDACCEWAQQLLVADRTADSDVEAQGLKRIKAGSIELEFDVANLEAKTVPDAVQMAVNWYGKKRSAGGGPVTMLRA